MELRLRNITASFAVDRKFDLTEISSLPEAGRVVRSLWKRKPKNRGDLDWTLYRLSNGRRKGFRSLRLKLDTGSKTVTALIYESGSVVLVGANSEEQLANAEQQIHQLYSCNTKTEMKIVNFVFSFRLPNPLHLEMLYTLPEFSARFDMIFEPELFPCLILTYKQQPKLKAKIFKSGSVIITGCKCKGDGEKIYGFLVERLK